jgi:hypothetical protein
MRWVGNIDEMGQEVTTWRGTAAVAKGGPS